MTLYTAGHLITAVPHCWHSRAPIVHTAVPRENNEHGCVYLRCRAVCKLPGCVEGHPWILLLYKTWWYYNKFHSTKSLGVCYWCVKIPQCGYMEHGSKHITFYVQKHIAALAMCYNPALVRDKQLGAPASVKLVYWLAASPVWLVCLNIIWQILRRGVITYTLEVGILYVSTYNCWNPRVVM